MQHAIDYNRIAAAIEFLRLNFKQQPTLEEVAGHVHLSSFHFQRLFKTWAGVTPKQFLQYISAEYAKGILKDGRSTLFDAAFETGLSGTGRLHDLFIKLEGMTPGEYRNGGEGLSISYSTAESPFGMVIVASTHRGICHMAFTDNGGDAAFAELQRNFPKAQYSHRTDAVQQQALSVFNRDWSSPGEIRLHVQGTAFQIKVWETLLNIPMGGLATYADIAGEIGNAGASRAVGTAIGSNPVAFLIPCHRVIKAGGDAGQYHWGSTRKHAMIGWEAARLHTAEAIR